MAERRTVSVGLIANVSNYVANMDRAAAATRKTAAAAVGSEKQLRAQGEVYTKLGTSAMAGGAIAAAGLALVISKTAEYGSKMAQLQSLSHASQADMKRLSAAAMEQGKAYGYSASQVADAEIELTKAGFNTKQILGGGLKSALSLAAAGQMDVAEATGITTVALTQFKLKASDLPHVSDMLAAGADKALGSVGDLGEALSNGGSAAAAMGIPLQDTIGVLSAFANAGTIGAEGGTQLKSMLMQLENQTPKSKKALEELGISVYDQQGKFVGLTNLAGQLSDKLGKKSVAERNAATSVIFGSYAQNAANVLIREGAKGIADWTAKVNEYGFANAQAAGKMNSLSGDVQKLGASFDTNLIKAGSGANDSLRGLVQTGEHLLDFVGGLPAPLLTAGTALTAAGAGVALVGGAALVATPKIQGFRTKLAEAGVSGKQVGMTFARGAALSIGIAALTEGLAGLGQQGQATKQTLAETSLVAKQGFEVKGLDKLFTSSTFGGAQAGLKNALDFEGLGSSVQKFGSLNGLISGLSDTVLRNEGTFDALGQQLSGLAQQDLPSAQRGFAGIVSQSHLTADQTKKLLGLMPAYRDTLADVAAKAGVAATDQNLLAIAQGRGGASTKVLAAQQREASAAARAHDSALQVLAGAANDGTVSINSLKDALKNLDGGQLSARDAARAYEQAVDDATAAAKKNGRTLDIATQAGRDNQGALDGVAAAATQSASAYLDAGGSASGASRIIRAGRKAYVDAAVSMGMSREAARKLAASLLGIPNSVSTKVAINGADGALGSIRAIQTEMKRLDGTTAVVTTVYRQDGQNSSISQGGKTGRTAKAGGGSVTGPGAKGVDSVDAVLAPGEHVLTAGDVDAMGGQGNVYAFRAALHMAKGGAVPTRGTIRPPLARDGVDTRKTKRKSPSNAISEAQRKADDADRRQKELTEQIKQAKDDAAADQKAADRLQKAYEDIDGSKKNRAAKKAAKDKADAAKKKADKASKKVDDLRSDRDDAQQKRDQYNDSAKQLRYDREDFVSEQRRATADNPIDPMSYVDELRQMSRDDNFSPARQKKYADAANDYERSLATLTDRSQKAAEKLSQLKDSAKEMHDGIKDAITGGYQLSNVANQAGPIGDGSWQMVGGLRVGTWSTSSISAGGIDDMFSKGAADSGEFAGDLDQLRSRGLDPQLLNQIAGYGVTEGSKYAKALLQASDTQIASINGNYAAIGGNADRAGQTVADANFAGVISAAQADADRITASIADEGGKLRKLIADAFGLKGYAVGTTSATPGLHLVGEQGPELLRFGGGERVYTAGQTAAYIRGGGAASRPAPQQPTPVTVRMPDTITVADASGFTATMRVVAQQEIAADGHAAAVMVWGGAA